MAGSFEYLAGTVYGPQHILVFHLGPVAILALIGAPLGPMVLRRI